MGEVVAVSGPEGWVEVAARLRVRILEHDQIHVVRVRVATEDPTEHAVGSEVDVEIQS
jgi:hypothetical protein